MIIPSPATSEKAETSWSSVYAPSEPDPEMPTELPSYQEASANSPSPPSAHPTDDKGSAPRSEGSADNAQAEIPPSFNRPPPTNVSYEPGFEPLVLECKGETLDKGFPRVPPPSSWNPHPFASHDVNEKDWTRFLNDLQDTASKELDTEEEPPLAQNLGLAGFFVRKLSLFTNRDKVNVDKKLEASVQVAALWNHHFFHPRRMEVALIRGQPRGFGRRGRHGHHHHHHHHGRGHPLARSPSSSSSSSSSDSDLSDTLTDGDFDEDGFVEVDEPASEEQQQSSSTAPREFRRGYRKEHRAQIRSLKKEYRTKKREFRSEKRNMRKQWKELRRDVRAEGRRGGRGRHGGGRGGPGGFGPFGGGRDGFGPFGGGRGGPGPFGGGRGGPGPFGGGRGFGPFGGGRGGFGPFGGGPSGGGPFGFGRGGRHGSPPDHHHHEGPSFPPGPPPHHHGGPGSFGPPLHFEGDRGFWGGRGRGGRHPHPHHHHHEFDYKGKGRAPEDDVYRLVVYPLTF